MNTSWSLFPKPVCYLVVGAEVQQPPGRVHEVREMVKQPESGPRGVNAHLPQRPVLGGHCIRQAQLQRYRHTCPESRWTLIKENVLFAFSVFKKILNIQKN